MRVFFATVVLLILEGTIHGQVINTVTLAQTPYVILDTSTGVLQYSGFFPDLLAAVLAEIGSNASLNVYEAPDGTFGNALASGNWTGAVGELISGRAEWFMGPLSITAARYQVIAFTPSFQEVGLSLLIQKPQAQSSIWGFFGPFSAQLWVLILCTTLIVSIAFFVLDHMSPFGMSSHDDPEERAQGTYREHLMGAFLPMLGAGSTPARSCSLRLFQLVFYFVVLILIATYTANLAAFLTLQQGTPRAASVEDLRRSGLPFVTVANSAPAAFFNLPEYSSMKVNMRLVSNIAEAVELVANGTSYALVW